MGDEADADWQEGLVEWGIEDAARQGVPLRKRKKRRPFYGAECPSYPNCSGGCGLGCTKEVERARQVQP